MGDEAIVRFRFVDHPEFIEPGSDFFFREGRTRGLGTIKSILSIENDPDPNPAEPKKNPNRYAYKEKRKLKRKMKSEALKESNV